MPITHLLDTSVYSQPLKPIPDVGVISRWKAIGDARMAVSVIAEAEVLFGIALKGSERLRAAYESLLRGRIAILPVDVLVGETFAALKVNQQKAGKRVPDLDLLIAATARTHGLIVATLNVRHFEMIEGIQVEDWSRG